MAELTFDELEKLQQTAGAAAMIDRLIAGLRAEKRFHPLFDALLMKRRQELGLGLFRPTTLRDVPETVRDEFEKYYVDMAREVGKLLLADHQIPQAWQYFRAINEPQEVARAIEALPENEPADEAVIEVALFQGVAPVKGLRMFLAAHGTCSTITAFDQHYLQLPPDVRRDCARVMVRKLYDDLRGNVEHDVQRRQPMNPPGQSLRELIGGREWLFADDSYHIDVSHLNSVVRFGRALDVGCPELDLALQLAQYGTRLAPQYQYAGNPPFSEFYPAHIEYFQAVLGQNQDQSLAYFRSKLSDDTADSDNQMTAFTLVDLLQRLGQTAQALEIAAKYLSESGEEFGVSLVDLCIRSGRLDMLQQIARGKGDFINFTAALLEAKSREQPVEQRELAR